MYSLTHPREHRAGIPSQLHLFFVIRINNIRVCSKYKLNIRNFRGDQLPKISKMSKMSKMTCSGIERGGGGG